MIKTNNTFSHLPVVTDEDMREPVKWFCKLNQRLFRDWFYFSVCHKNLYPFPTDKTSYFALSFKEAMLKLSDFSRNNSSAPDFNLFIRDCTAEMFNEMPTDTAGLLKSLEDLDVLTELISGFNLNRVVERRCTIINTLHRCPDSWEASNVKGRMLEVISLFKENEYATRCFEERIVSGDKNIAALCYRALYLKKSDYAIEYFETIRKTYSDDPEFLDQVLALTSPKINLEKLLVGAIEQQSMKVINRRYINTLNSSLLKRYQRRINIEEDIEEGCNEVIAIYDFEDTLVYKKIVPPENSNSFVVTEGSCDNYHEYINELAA